MKLARLCASLVVAGTMGASFGQTVIDGYNNVRGATSDIRITLTGTDTRGGGSRYRTEATYRDLGTSQPAEVLEFSGTISTPDTSLPIVRRLVGDGTTMWGYSVVKNTYTALRYGQYKGGQLTTYRDDFFHALTSAGYGQSSPAIRLLSDLYENGGGAMYKPWFTGTAPMLTLAFSSPLTAQPPVWNTPPKGSGYPDPLDPGLVYTPSPSTQFQFTYEPNLARSISFELEQDPVTNVWYLTDVNSVQWFNGGNLAEWHMAIDRTPTIAPNQFVFIPPQNSHAIVTRVGG